MSELTPTPEIRIALFGQSQAGKTALLSSYYGNLQSSAPDEGRCYSLLANDQAQGTLLLAKYYEMEAGTFPQSTAAHEDYAFNLEVDGLKGTCVRVHILDYPGGWWDGPSEDSGEEADRLEVLGDLQRAQVGVLLVDGARFKENGGRYLKALFDQFRQAARHLQEHTALDGPAEGPSTPSSWIIALSKADLFPEDYSARDFERDVVRHAAENLKRLSDTLGSTDIGSRYLLLSAARGHGNTVDDARATLGLPLLAPLAFKSALLETAERAASRAGEGTRIERAIRIARNLVRLLDEADDWLPKKLQVISHLIKAVEVEDFLAEKLDVVRAKRQRAVEKGNAYEAAAYAMAEQLRHPSDRPLYYDNQPATAAEA